MAPVTRYFTFDHDGHHRGLFRRIQDDEAQTLTDERVDSSGTWIVDPNLARHFRDAYDVVEIDEAEAAKLAERYGVSL